MRVSSVDQHPETQLHDLRQMAAQRGFEIVQEYTDRISGVKARRPGLGDLMRDARHGKFDVILVWACDRIARSTRHLLEILDEFNRLNIEFVSFRENIDTSGPLGRAIVVIIGAIAELERNLIIERVRAGMRRAKLEGRHIGSPSRSTGGQSTANAAKARVCARSPAVIASRRPQSAVSSPSSHRRSGLHDRTLRRLPTYMDGVVSSLRLPGG
jgi:DNA invertase Pin-like site-specific DNA recombinase